MRKALIAVTVASALFAVGALAANLSVQSDNLASGQDPVEQCGNAAVEWTTDESVNGDGDWAVTGATVTFDNAACNGAVVDLAIGLNTDADTDVDSWVEATCTEGAASYACTPATQPPVNQVIDVAVLANGNSVTALTPA